jgi:hypothetical protein
MEGIFSTSGRCGDGARFHLREGETHDSREGIWAGGWMFFPEIDLRVAVTYSLGWGSFLFGVRARWDKRAPDCSLDRSKRF